LPSKLLDRLNEFYDETPAAAVMPVGAHPTGALHWPVGTPTWGGAMHPVQTVVIHETTGYPTYMGSDSFVERYTVIKANRDSDGPHFYVDGNGTAHRLIDITPPTTVWHATYLNLMSIGIENGDLGDNLELGPDAVIPASDVAPVVPPDTPAQIEAKRAAYEATARARWRALSTNAQDLHNMKAHMLLHPGLGVNSGPAEGVLIWFGTAQYDGPQDAANTGSPFRRMLFTERNYRSLVLLCRYLAEQLQLPRNFPVFPWEAMDQNITSVDKFRKIVLADERSDYIAQAALTTTAALTANAPTLAGWYTQQIHARDGTFKQHNMAWRKMLDNSVNGAGQGGFRGFHGHGFAGDIYHYDNHSLCPGPFFDWHRFSREVWDWWWWPFDFEPVPLASTPTVQLSTSQRDYRKARATTPLREFYYDAGGQPSDYTAARVAGDTVTFGGNAFTGTNQTPVLAMANGVMVAACIPNPAIMDPTAQRGFALVRHEVFYQTAANRIDYDRDPTIFYTLTHFIDNPHRDFADVSDSNPDWLNRFLVRLTETELAVTLHTDRVVSVAANPAQVDLALQHAWARMPRGNQRRTLGDEISNDAVDYRQIATDLSQGNVALFPLELRPGTTPVRVILGDFLGFPGAMGGGQTGVMVDVFSVDPLTEPFSLASASSTLPVARQVASPLMQTVWWNQVCGFVALEQNPAKRLPFEGVAYHYDVVDFLAWINNITWNSEWPKYEIVDVVHTGAPPRPKSRK
jgi:hypothetical protein